MRTKVDIGEATHQPCSKEVKLKSAKQFVDDHDVEVWQLDRIVTKLSSKPE
jgi:hypothetical protein